MRNRTSELHFGERKPDAPKRKRIIQIYLLTTTNGTFNFQIYTSSGIMQTIQCTTKTCWVFQQKTDINVKYSSSHCAGEMMESDDAKSLQISIALRCQCNRMKIACCACIQHNGASIGMNFIKIPLPVSCDCDFTRIKSIETFHSFQESQTENGFILKSVV